MESGLAMAEIEALNKRISGKIKFLKFISDETEEILDKKEPRDLERQLNLYETKLEEYQSLKMQILELKIENDEKTEDVKKWRLEIDGNLKEFEPFIEKLKNSLADIRGKQLGITQKKAGQQTGESSRTIQVKLPKLEITKFKGTHIDWFRFWNQFEAEIDKQSIDPVTKFNYLKEFLDPKARLLIENLMHNSEGYTRAKQILKTRFGKSAEVVNAHIEMIMNLPHIKGVNVARIHDFLNKLLPSIQALESMGKLGEISGYARMTLNKLEGIRADLIRLDDNWQEWGFPQLVEALVKWTERNPMHHEIREKVFTATQGAYQKRQCVYCGNSSHKSADCKKIEKVSERRNILREKRLCFNCTGSGHRAASCESKGSCRNCRGKHHTSVCDREQREPEVLLTTGEHNVVYPVVVVKVEGVTCRALLDTGAGSSYLSNKLVEIIGKKLIREESRQIDMMLTSVTKRIEIYNVELKNLKGTYRLSINLNKVDRGELLKVPNPNYERLIAEYSHLRGIHMDDRDQKEDLPIHVIIGASDFAKIKTPTKPRIGKEGEPIAELTNFGWVIMSPGRESVSTNALLTRTKEADFERLWSLDVLGLEEKGEENTVHQVFKEQLERSPEGWYETGLIWKTGIPELPSNEIGSKARLQKLVGRLERQPELFQQYEEIIKEQEEQGIIDKVLETSCAQRGKEFYLPHRAVVREGVESTKVRIVYDASAKANENSPSLNDCLETGPPLQNHIWDILSRNRMQPWIASGDIKQAFLQIRIRESDQDVLRFHWPKDRDMTKLEVYRFTRVLFGLNQSPFILGATLDKHLSNYVDKYPEEVAEIKRSLFVDDVILGGGSLEEVKHLKQTAENIFGEAQFKLHKWHANSNEIVPEREVDRDTDIENSFAKHQLRVTNFETRILGVNWDTATDTISTVFNLKDNEMTKRGVLQALASIYDPLGLAAPITLIGKSIFREICEGQQKWDSELSERLKAKWLKWINSLPKKVTVPRSIPSREDAIKEIELHVFADASLTGVAAVVYAHVVSEKGSQQGLLTAKARISKKGLTIPRLELISAHMAANLVENVKRTLLGYPITAVIGWLDSLVALHWIKDGNKYKQFVSNRVAKIKEKDYILWRHVPTAENPADIASRGCHPSKLNDSWFKGPEWMREKILWPPNIATKDSEETESEAKTAKLICKTAVEENDSLDQVLEKFTFKRCIRITALVRRFIANCKIKRNERKRGPITTDEFNSAQEKWILRVQKRHEQSEKFEEEVKSLGLKKNEKEIYVCHGRIQGEKPVFLPSSFLYTERVIAHAHHSTLCGGVGLTMAKVRETFWVPRLRQITKKVIKSCYSCKRFHVTPYNAPKPGLLPNDRTEGQRPFEVVGVDFAGPIKYIAKKKTEGKAYIVMFACSLTRAVYIELLQDSTVSSFMPSLKGFIARRGRPRVIYSDNAQSFKAAASLIKAAMRDERLQGYLTDLSISWRFNVSKAPWWGGQFERIIGLTKGAMYRVLGKANLKFEELKEILLDVEMTLNNRPLSYVEDDIQLPVLTPNMMLINERNALLETNVNEIKERDLRKRAKYLNRCRDNLWKRWKTEYIRSLRERHNMKAKDKDQEITIGQVVMIHGEEKNRGVWKIGVVEQLIQGRDGIVRAVRLRTGKNKIERAVQMLYPLELQCDVDTTKELNPQAREFRPQRRAAKIAKESVTETFRYEDE